MMANEMKWTTSQRNGLKPCPFCGTPPMERGRVADNATSTQWQIGCSNPFCAVQCRTDVFASIVNAEDAWQSREEATNASK